MKQSIAILAAVSISSSALGSPCIPPPQENPTITSVLECFEARITELEKENKQRITELKKENQELRQQLAEVQQKLSEKVDKPKPPVWLSDTVFQDPLKDGSLGPKMAQLPSAIARMGKNLEHSVLISQFAMGVHEVTFAEYDKFAEATGRSKPSDNGWGRGNRPVINVSWHDATAYTDWLSEQTGHEYRLPTEAQWEYAARAGTTTHYWWGNDVGSNNAVCYSCGSRWDNKSTAPVGSFAANPFGLYDTAGNVWEWTCSQYEGSYNGQEQRCAKGVALFVLRGCAWFNNATRARSANRNRDVPTSRSNGCGFRAARIK
jgi:formylglycine-generating enzyme required for sulfatase activity